MRILLVALLTFLFSCQERNVLQEEREDVAGVVEDNKNVNVNINGDVIVGATTNNSTIISVASSVGTQITIDYGTSQEKVSEKSITKTAVSDITEFPITALSANCRYYYQLRFNGTVQGDIYSFVTQRIKGSTYSFGVQGDSHPERTKEMFYSELYSINMKNVANLQPDFYFTIGDDFSTEHLIDNGTCTQQNVEKIYSAQRKNLGIVGCNSTLFLINGNHEQAAKYLLDGTATNPAVLAGNARKKYYPLPEPDGGIYSGDLEKVEHIGYLKDYYAFEWGDALFVTIDPYWHSNTAVDNVAGSMDKTADPWAASMGNEQYNWLKKTLSESNAKYKFVFAHHVNGTGRGGIESAKLYEWGGFDQKNKFDFTTYRPAWDMPIHQLFVKYGVTIFFQGHDHLFCKQELDGVVYQSLPNPADNTYRAFNADGYKSGDVLSNSGHLNVKVSPEEVVVKYVRAYLTGDGINNEIAYTYTIK